MNSQLRLRRRQSMSPATLFCTIATFCCVVIFLCFFFSHGELINNYFHKGSRDVGMDFFHSIEYVRGRVPYGKYNTLYPPLANLFFLLIYRMVPTGVSEQWADSYRESVMARGTDIDLRTHQAPMLCFIIVLVIAVWMLISLITTLMENQPRERIHWTTFCMLISPGMVCAFERGNIMFLVVPLILFFVKNRNAENPIVRELALICLAIAAGLKLYPAFFGVLLIREKRWKEAARAVLYGIAAVLLPMLAFDEGLRSLGTWLNIVFGFRTGTKDIPWEGYVFSHFLHLGAFLLRKFWQIEICTSWFKYADYVVTIILLISALRSKTEWQGALSIATAILMFKSQGIYSLSLFCIPMLFFFLEEPRITRKNVVPFILMLAVTVNLPVFHPEPGIGIRWDYIIRQIINVLITCWCIAAPLINRRVQHGNME